MEKLLYISVFLFGLFTQAQTAFHNAGNIRVHANGQLSLHTNLINNNTWDSNQGLVGFYGDNPLSVVGAFVPEFYDVEVALNNGLLLNTGISTENNTNFIAGDVVTPRNQTDIYYHFLQDAFYVGASNPSKIDGYAALSGQSSFIFPVGDAQFLRPLIITSVANNALAKCAYFFESPTNPSTFPSFDIDRKPRTLGPISTREFWRLEGNVTSNISISWDTRSAIGALNTDINAIVPVAWSKSGQQWISLGVTARGGDLDQGFVTSENFLPDDYDIITFGALATPTEILTLDNYIVTPNGDGINDFLEIPQLELSPNNSVRIFDRNGLMVFEQLNYTNEFVGIANTDNLVIKRNSGLPFGVYFYVITLDDLDLNFQGFLVLSVK